MVEAAGRRVRQAHIKHPDALRMCWVAKKKEDWGLAPNRWVRRSETWVRQELVDSTEPLDIKIDSRRKLLQCKRPGNAEWQSMGAPGDQRWVWYAIASEFLTEVHREAGAAYIAGR